MLPLNTTERDVFIIHPVRKPGFTSCEVHFTSRSPTNACLLPGSITKFTGLLSLHSNMPNVPWGDVIADINHPVLTIRPGHEQDAATTFRIQWLGQ